VAQPVEVDERINARSLARRGKRTLCSNLAQGRPFLRKNIRGATGRSAPSAAKRCVNATWRGLPLLPTGMRIVPTSGLKSSTISVVNSPYLQPVSSTAMAPKLAPDGLAPGSTEQDERSRQQGRKRQKSAHFGIQRDP
jgi:hypothetical protein